MAPEGVFVPRRGVSLPAALYRHPGLLHNTQTHFGLGRTGGKQVLPPSRIPEIPRGDSPRGKPGGQKPSAA